MVIVLTFFLILIFVCGQWPEMRGAKLSVCKLSDSILLAVTFQWLTPVAPQATITSFRITQTVTPVVGNLRNFLNRVSPPIFLFSRNHWLSENRAKAK
jgi:hypothetical protein